MRGSLSCTATTTVLLSAAATKVHEERDAEGDHADDEVLVGCEAAAVEEDVHEHDGDELAGLAEDHGGVGDVLEGGEAEGGRGDDEDGGPESPAAEGQKLPAPEGRPSSIRSRTLDVVPESDEVLATALGRREESPSSDSRFSKRSRRGGPRPGSPVTRGESLADLPVAGPGLDLAAELGRAENKDILEGRVDPARPAAATSPKVDNGEVQGMSKSQSSRLTSADPAF